MLNQQGIQTTIDVAGKILTSYVERNVACMLWGGPGIGKSDIVRAIAANLGLPMIDTRVSQLDAVDLRGIPSVEKLTDSLRTVWATPKFFPDTGEGVWFFDEINSAPPSVQAALYQLINDRQLGEYTIPDNWRIVAAGNRESDGGVTYKMAKPLANRFRHLYVSPDANCWVQWALDNGIDSRIIAAVRSGYMVTGGEAQESAVYHFERQSDAFLTPRSLARCSAEIAAYPVDCEERHISLCGLIGTGHGAELTAYLRLCDEIPSLASIRSNPKMVAIPANPSVIYAIACGIGRTMDLQTIAADFTFLRRLNTPEYGMLVMQDVMRRDKSLHHHAEWRKWLVDHSDLIVPSTR